MSDSNGDDGYHVEDETGRLSEEDKKKLEELGERLMAANSEVFRASGFSLDDVGFVTFVSFGQHTGHVSNLRPSHIIGFVSSQLEDMTGMKVLIVNRLTRIEGSNEKRMH